MGANFHSDWTTSTVFSPTDMNPPLQSLDRAITYIKNVIMHCDGVITYDSTTGQLVWDGILRILFSTSAGLLVENVVAIGGVTITDGQMAYVDLSETNGASVSVAVTTLTTGGASTILPFNRVVLGYRNSTADTLYPVLLAHSYKSSDIADMVKSVYDTDNDGQVEKADAADAVNWSGILQLPTAIGDIAGATLAGNAGKALIVNPAGTGIILGAAGATVLTGLSDFPSSYTDMAGKILAVKSDATGVEFVSASGGGAALGDLTNVLLTSPTDGQALVFDETDSKWKNETVSGGGGTASFASVATIASLIGGF